MARKRSRSVCGRKTQQTNGAKNFFSLLLTLLLLWTLGCVVDCLLQLKATDNPSQQFFFHLITNLMLVLTFVCMFRCIGVLKLALLLLALQLYSLGLLEKPLLYTDVPVTYFHAALALFAKLFVFRFLTAVTSRC